MAPRRPNNRDSLDEGEGGDEIFTDLHGNPDTVEGEEGTDAGDGDQIEDDAELEDDLRVTDDEEGDDQEGDEVDEDEEEEETNPAGPAAGSDFDPKDVLILTKDAELLEERKANLKTAEDRATADLAAAEAAMIAAKENGDSKADVEATKKYAGATAEIERLKTQKASLGQAENEIKHRAQALLAKAPKDALGNPILTGDVPARAADAREKKQVRASKLIDKFKKVNPWFGNSKYSAQQKRLVEIDKGIAAEGRLDKDTPEYFQELGRRFNQDFPGLYKTLDGKPVATGQRRRGQGAPVPNGGGTGANRQEGSGEGKVTLTQADLGLMKKFGLDPNSKEARRNWLREKRAQAQGGR